MKTLSISTDLVQGHFTARAERYDSSSHWCTDPIIAQRIVEHTSATPEHSLLDVACGTGLVARHFKGHVARVVGVDFTAAMYEQARPHVDELVVAPAEDMPFEDETFDRVVCRQGIQFMDAPAAAAEMVRVLKPGGRICIINLCAYDQQDRDEYYEILRLRNPARRNFFMRGDLSRLLAEAGCREVQVHDHISTEDVDAWSDNGAIEEQRREAIRQVYRQASPAFRRLHSVELADGRIVDHMLFGIAVGTK